MPILGRNPFGHHEEADTHSAHGHAAHAHGHPPQPLRRSSRSFLSFMSRKPSLESIRSDKSSDSLSDMHQPVMNNVSHSTNHPVPGGSHGHGHNHSGTASPAMSPKPSHSMVELKRFFRSSKLLSMTHGHPTHTTTHTPPHSHSQSTTNVPGVHSSSRQMAVHHPHSSTQLNLNSHLQMTGNENHHGHTQSAVPPSADSALSLSNTINIYHDDTILAQKYGRLGKTLGSGAGGSVKVLVRPSDNATFAVKEFRPRKSNESVKQYAKKCTAEFCIGSSLHHPNIVETIDIFSDSNQFKYFQVMEYLPIDFFGVVMTGQMSRGEINCCLKQLCDGVRYLHSMGLAHRDLKLDNCCMTEFGILKIIDFGSAVVFKYPFEDAGRTHNAHGIVGSDPYLAPEVITSTKSYDPQAVDVWSIGIIFCCMMLKRFPWKAPKLSDDNFKLYSMPDDIERDYEQSAKHHEHLLQERRKHREHAHAHAAENGDAEAPPPQHKIEQLPTPVEQDGEEKAQEKTAESTAEKTRENAHAGPTHTVVEAEKPQDTATSPEEQVHQQKSVSSSRTAATGVDQKSISSSKTTTPAPAPHGAAPAANGTSSAKGSAPAANGHPHKRVIHGPYRLLRLLPHASRPILSKMLSIDPANRATLDDMFADSWFADIPACTMDAKNNVVRAHGHHHTIVKDGKTYKI